MRFELEGKVIRTAVSRLERGAVTFELSFTDGTDFAYQVSLAPSEDGKLFDSRGEVLESWSENGKQREQRKSNGHHRAA